MTKYIFVTGGVVSGLGKGITAASLGRLLKSRGFRVTMQKFDPYLNFDPGVMNPYQHGEVFVTDDGAETDLDLGHYERFIDESLTKNSNITSGKIYWNVIKNEREGKYGGGTVQLIPHITNEIKERIAIHQGKCDFSIIEIGGTVGDIESLPYLEAIRQFATDVGRSNCAYIHVTLIPYIAASHELKTKPTQHSVKELLSIGIQPDFLVCRTDRPIDNGIREKLALFCNVKSEHVIINADMESLYEVPLSMLSEGIDVKVCKVLGVDPGRIDITDWSDMVKKSKHLEKCVKIALVGKYTGLPDAYLSVVEALRHGGIATGCKVEIKWVSSEGITPDNVAEQLMDCDGVLIPGGFGSRGIDGMIVAAGYAREHGVPYFGICLGLHMAAIEFARNVIGLESAHTTEIDENSPHPVIDLLPEQRTVTQLGGTMRLGSYPCRLNLKSRSYELYGSEEIAERHRHRYEFNNNYREDFEKGGMMLAGLSPDGRIVEMLELTTHPYFVCVQFHPEFKSRPNRPHPLFRGFVGAARDRKYHE